jgi:hypothetical protein
MRALADWKSAIRQTGSLRYGTVFMPAATEHMSAFENPALKAFTASLGESTRVAQVLIRRVGESFELQHADDGDDTAFRMIAIAELRELAQSAHTGAFRPLRAAPNLRRGWYCQAANPAELEIALEHLYPGFLADWHAAQSGHPATPYRDYTRRQTGMYRLAALADDAQAAHITRVGCDARFCLKRRLWSAPTLAADAPDGKSIIPCFEPCALLLEFARKAVRITQESKVPVEISPSDLQTIRAALQAALEHPDPGLREADFGSPANPRRALSVLEQLRHLEGEQ